MRLNRFYTERTNLREGSSIKLEDSDVNHIRKVLRLQKGDQIVIFNGEKEFLAELDIVGSEFTMATIKKVLRNVQNEKKNIEITLFQGLLKAGKFDDILEKTTELGIDYVVPMECEFSQSKVEHARDKIERWNKVLVAASKQSERIKVPGLIQPMEFKEALEHANEFDEVFFFTTDRSTDYKILSLGNPTIDASVSKIAYFIGPEGGFSPQEHKLAIQKDLKFYTMSNTVLRSETAAIFGAGLLNFLYN